jgi:hypothetical protein
MAHQCEQQRSCPRGLTATRRFPLQERRNPPPLLPSSPHKKKSLLNLLKFIPPPKNFLFPFPCSTDPVPDASIDYTELWKAVCIAKQTDEDNSKVSARGTEAYADILYRLGVDIEELGNAGNPEDVIDLNHYPPPATVEYPNLSTNNQLQELANKHKRYTVGSNEATLATRIMRHILIDDDIPDFDARDRSTVLRQVLEFQSAFTGFD